MQTILERYRRARAAAVPLIAIETADPPATEDAIATAIAKSNEARAAAGKPQSGIVHWDAARGTTDARVYATGLADVILGGKPDHTVGSPKAFLATLQAIYAGLDATADIQAQLWERATYIVHGADTAFETTPETRFFMAQAACNLRDLLKPYGAAVVFLTSGGPLHPLVDREAEYLREPLPTAAQLESVVDAVLRSAKESSTRFAMPDATSRREAAQRLVGLSPAAAEQAASLACGATEIDLGALWSGKRDRIDRTKGLQVYRGEERFGDLGGVEAAKRFFRAVIGGREPPGAVCFVDEIEKAIGGSAGGDASGVSTGILQQLLVDMEDTGSTGAIFLGPPGACKSALAKAIGNEAGVLTVSVDLGGMKGEYVGSTEGAVRHALRTLRAIAGERRQLWVATCNDIQSIPPELQRRFGLGIFFFDLPTPEERRAIWEIYTARYSGVGTELPDDDGWTGAEIKRCCHLAWSLNMSLRDAAQWIVPVAVSDSDRLERLRAMAHGRYLSASTPGTYRAPRPTLSGQQRATKGRRLGVT